jgi:hypothetical protein
MYTPNNYLKQYAATFLSGTLYHVLAKTLCGLYLYVRSYIPPEHSRQSADYYRHGTMTLFAALDVLTGREPVPSTAKAAR